ncbi:MAG: aromatic amino acid transaminase [Chlamydiales bacterium]
MSFFEQISLATPDPIFGLIRAFQADPRPNKVNLTVGLYRNEELKTPVLECVKKAEKEILHGEKTKEYLPLEGDKIFLDQAGALVFGETFWSSSQARVARIQAVGGTSALRTGGEFLSHEKIGEAIYLSDPTWANHKAIFPKAGLKVEYYPYYDRERHEFNFEAMCHALEKLPPKSIILLHASCHNPTGADLNLEQWKKLSGLFFAKRLIPFFDFAYQGLDRGVEQDAEAVRLFAKEGHEMLVAYSLSKSFSLYAERVGALFAVGGSHKVAEHLNSKLVAMTRPNYSNPPLHGARIVATILTSPQLREEWEKELGDMRARIIEMRTALAEKLITKSHKVDFSFLKNRAGLFTFSGLSGLQVERLIKEHAIYMTADGRLNAAGLNHQNLDTVVNAILAVL